MMEVFFSESIKLNGVWICNVFETDKNTVSTWQENQYLSDGELKKYAKQTEKTGCKINWKKLKEWNKPEYCHCESIARLSVENRFGQEICAVCKKMLYGTKNRGYHQFLPKV